ncbi:MAG: hypothetical protein KGN16_08955 [Burkholderiales bacterium]|nr:hypothetical protein [Burkholderiales bacterium]
MEPIEGSVDPFLELATGLIPADDEREHVLNWLANLVQNEGDPPGTYLALQGPKGCGKNSFTAPMQRIYGTHAGIYSDPELVCGRFTLHLADKRLIVMDEGTFVGDPRQVDRIKSTVTATDCIYEGKGLPPIPGVNRAAFILMTNHAHAVEATTDERRPIVVTLGDRLRGKREFWARYYRWLEGTGPAALLWWLQRRDLTGFDPRSIPRTTALQEQVELTLLRQPGTAWWHAILVDGAIPRANGADGYVPLNENAPTEVPRRAVRESFDRRNMPGRATFDATMRDVRRWSGGNIRDLRPTTDKGRIWCYELPALQELRAAFTASTGITFDRHLVEGTAT